jgi:hypothetical protein
MASSVLYASTAGASTSTSGPIVTSATNSQASVSPQLTVPAIPGFPWESILVGAILGMLALAYSRKRK